MAATLPDDLLHMICETLWEQQDFDTLYQCALSGKQLAYPALASLYRMHDVAPVTGAGGDEIEDPVHDKSNKPDYETTLKSQQQVILKWASMWRSIILSSLGKTLFNYSQYVRTLHFQDLQYLLEDAKFGGKVGNMFFEGELGRYKVERTIQGVGKKKNYVRIDAIATINKFAEVITLHTPVLEELSGEIHGGILAECIPRLPKLQRLNPWSGEALQGTGHLIHQYCPLFNTLQFYGWHHPEADQHLAKFLNDIRPQTLQSFETFSASQIGAESFIALNCHRESLKELKLNSIKAEAIQAIPMLKECTNLTSLLLAENGAATQDLENWHNEKFLEIIAWLRECNGLRILALNNFKSAPALLTPILLENNIKLTELNLEGYSMPESTEFHSALAQQQSLQVLWLKGDGGEVFSPDVERFVHSLCKLENLTDLKLRDISDGFTNKQICQLAQCLQKLESLWISGYGITDDIWGDLASLKSLRQLELNAYSRFTADGIMNFILNLGPGNKGLVLNILMQELEWDLSEEEQAAIREMIGSQVDGRFGFTFFRDYEQDSFDSDSD